MSDRLTPGQLADYAALNVAELVDTDPDAAATVARMRDLLVGEIHRLRGVLGDAGDQVARLDDHKEHLDFLERNTLPELHRNVEHHKAGKQRWRERAEKAEAERDALQKRLYDAAMTRTWRNEDGKKFVFVEDIAPALLGKTPGTEVVR